MMLLAGCRPHYGLNKNEVFLKIVQCCHEFLLSHTYPDICSIIATTETDWSDAQEDLACGTDVPVAQRIFAKSMDVHPHEQYGRGYAEDHVHVGYKPRTAVVDCRGVRCGVRYPIQVGRV